MKREADSESSRGSEKKEGDERFVSPTGIKNNESFTVMTNRYGRRHEPGLILYYFLKKNPLILRGIVPLFFKLISKGRIRLLTKIIGGTTTFYRILNEADILWKWPCVSGKT